MDLINTEAQITVIPREPLDLKQGNFYNIKGTTELYWRKLLTTKQRTK